MKNTTLRRIISTATLAVAALSLTACKTMPESTAPAAAPPIAAKSTVDLMLEVRSKELDLERTDQMAWLKFAAESGSDMVKGFVMGRSASKGAGASQGGGSSVTQTVMQAQAHADEVALRREENAEKYGWFNKGLALLDRGLGFAQFSRGLSFDKYKLDAGNSQTRYMFDTYRGTQQDAYSFTGSAYTQGSAATLGGFSAAGAAE